MAQMILTSTGSSTFPPTRRTTRSWSARRSFTCIGTEVSPISSRNRVPPSASWNSPFFSFTAPVKAPFSCPKSSDSRRFSGSAPQLMETKVRAGAG